MRCPLSALLSQVLVAYTLEFDNEFERRMGEAGYPGAVLSLIVWLNVVRFLGGAATVHHLAGQAPAAEQRVKFELGCLERWGFVTLAPDKDDERPVATRVHPRAKRVLRDGWGSGRGIRAGWLARLTEKGHQAAEIWPPLFREIEQRWQARFGGDKIGGLRDALADVAVQLDLELPQGFPAYRELGEAYPPRGARDDGPLPLSALLAQLLLAFCIEFDRESPAPLALCANALRLLAEAPTPAGDLKRLVGGVGAGWQIRPYVSVASDPQRRGKLVRLSPRGIRAHQRYGELAVEIETRWEARFGKDTVRRLRESLEGLLLARRGERPLLAEGLVPAPGTVRSGVQAPALGRRDVGAAARQRVRDMAAQTEMFLEDPAGTLPHYPPWDMNRGFGP